MLGGSWEVATLEANADFDWGVTYYPVSETGTAVSPCGDWAAAVSKDCENPDAAGRIPSVADEQRKCSNLCSCNRKTCNT